MDATTRAHTHSLVCIVNFKQIEIRYLSRTYTKPRFLNGTCNAILKSLNDLSRQPRVLYALISFNPYMVLDQLFNKYMSSNTSRPSCNMGQSVLYPTFRFIDSAFCLTLFNANSLNICAARSTIFIFNQRSCLIFRGIASKKLFY